METMDLSVIHNNQGEVIGVQNILKSNYESNVFKLKETYEETDVKGNNNLFNSLKTETNNDLDDEPSSLFQDETFKNENPNLVGEASLFSCSTFKKAIDLRIDNRSLERNKRTIFEDAEYFAKNYLYKLLPITFDSVDEEIIHSEHSYCHLSLNSESDDEEDCSRTMDYTRIKEKNYKKRKTKFKQADCKNISDGTGGSEQHILEKNFQNSIDQEDRFNVEPKNQASQLEQELVYSTQPLDLSTPLVQEKKTDHCLREHPISILNKNVDVKERSELENENVKSKLRSIEVTITRPDEKENYQPCDLFLNDIAKLVPRLIEKDCSEIDILDRTCDDYVDFRKHRLYYIISKSTWRLFQSANERVILTNDQSLGQPALKVEGNERPTFLVFDQFSLAKCLADYCKEIGGCFEYTCVEESEDLQVQKEEEEDVMEEKGISDAEFQVQTGHEKQCTQNEVQIKFENVKCGEVGNKSVDIKGNQCLTKSPCCNYEKYDEKKDGNKTMNFLCESEKTIVEAEAVEGNMNKKRTEEGETELSESEFEEEIKGTTSFDVITCSTENKSDVDGRREISSEREVNLVNKDESKTTEEKSGEEYKQSLGTTEKAIVVEEPKEINVKYNELEKKPIKIVKNRKRKRDVNEPKTDIEIKKSNIVSRVTTRSKSTASDSKKRAADASKIITSQNKDEAKVKERKELKRKAPVLERPLKVDIKMEIPKRRKKTTSLQISVCEVSFERRTRSGKLIDEGKNVKNKKETEVVKQCKSKNVKKNEKIKTKEGQEGPEKTKKTAETAICRRLRSQVETSRKNVTVEKQQVEVRTQQRVRKKTVVETTRKQKEKAIGFSSRRKTR